MDWHFKIKKFSQASVTQAIMNNKTPPLPSLLFRIKSFSSKLFSNHFYRTIFFYGLILAALVTILKFFEYRYFVRELSIEVYLGIVALLCTILGIWIGLKIINSKKDTPLFVIDQKTIKKLGISDREYDVLELMAKGLSNQEIADRLFISLPTVKTHASNLFDKLDARRRTQAILKAKKLKIIP